MDFKITFPGTVDGRGLPPSLFSIESWWHIVNERLSYDPETGILAWADTGIQAGTVSGNYIAIQILGYRYGAHQLAWFIVHGEWAFVDHRDSNGFNNKLLNLRAGDYQLNALNRRITNSSTGVVGVCLQHGKYAAKIKVKQKQIYLGLFSTLEEAANARREAEDQYFGKERDWNQKVS